MFLEVLDRKDNVRERVAVSSLPLTIGRAYTNHVILDDPYVSPVHVQLVRDEKGLWLEDIDSTNGLVIHPGDATTRRGAVTSGACFRLGNTLIRFRAPGHPVPPALAQWAFVRRFDRLLGTGRFQVALLVVCLLDILLHRYFTTYRKVEWSQVVADEISGLIAFALVYLGFWSLIAVMFTGQSRFRRNVAVLGIVVSITTACKLVTRYVDFALDLDVSGDWIALTQGFSIIALALYAHIRTCTDARPARCFTVATLISALCAVGVGMKEFKERTEFSPVARFSETLLPPACRISRPTDLDGFLAGAKTARERVDREAKD